MNALMKKQGVFINILLSATLQQQKALLKTINKSQMQAIVQIVYNILIGNRHLPKQIKKDLQTQKHFIRRFVSKGLGIKKRKQILISKFKYIIPFLKVVSKELWRRN